MSPQKNCTCRKRRKEERIVEIKRVEIMPKLWIATLFFVFLTLTCTSKRSIPLSRSKWVQNGREIFFLSACYLVLNPHARQHETLLYAELHLLTIPRLFLLQITFNLIQFFNLGWSIELLDNILILNFNLAICKFENIFVKIFFYFQYFYKFI
jgi:hypothetical protein